VKYRFTGSVHRTVGGDQDAQRLLCSPDRQARLLDASLHVDQALHSSDGTDDVARYVIDAPVREGLVGTAREYQYSGFDTTATGEGLPRAAHQGKPRPSDSRSGLSHQRPGRGSGGRLGVRPGWCNGLARMLRFR
jgi:hypothetical protein